MTIRWIVISFLVSVPVLSEQMTDAEPSVSTDDSFFTMARWRAIRCTPRARTTDRIAGSPSGTAATASDTPTQQHVDQVGRRPGCPAVSRIAPTTTTAIDDHRDAEHAADPRDLALQRRRLLLGATEQAGDVAHLGRHARGGHDGPARGLASPRCR